MIFSENVKTNVDCVPSAFVISTFLTDQQILVALWCSAYHYCTTSFNYAWTQILRRFKPYAQRVGDSRWWGSLTMVPAGNKAKRLSSFNHTTKAIHQHHHHHHHHHHQLLKDHHLIIFVYLNKLLLIYKDFSCNHNLINIQ